MPENQKTNNQKRQKKITLQLCGFIILLILINIGATFINGKVDLTKDNRYTITPATKKLLKDLPEKVEVTVFLTGDDLPAAFRKLSRSTLEMLRNFRDISNNKISFRTLDPLGNDSLALKLLNNYRMAGIPVTIGAGKKGISQRMIFPWALITLRDDKGMTHGFPIFLQESNTPQLSRSILLRSEMLLEYSLANGIHQVTKTNTASVAYLTGNGESFGYHIVAAFNALSHYYRLDTFNLEKNIQIPNTYRALIINQPEKPFSETAKFKLDQYLMNGGRLFINVDGATGSLDSFNTEGRFNSLALDLNLDDLLYHYGVRLNHDLLEDAVNCAGIPLTAQGNNPEPVIYPWVYFPVLQAGSDHPIVKNLNGVLGRFVSTLDTNANDPAIRKTILLASSDYSKIEPTPTPILLESAMVEKNPASFLQKKLAAAILLEGKFQSAYANRMPLDVRQFIEANHLPVKSEDPGGSKIIAASDGALMMNEFSEKSGPSDLGIYRYSDFQFDNKTFLLNSMEYLTDPDNLLEARAKRFEKHLLDPKRIDEERDQWQWINIGVPIASVILLGFVFGFIRKKRFG